MSDHAELLAALRPLIAEIVRQVRAQMSSQVSTQAKLQKPEIAEYAGTVLGIRDCESFGKVKTVRVAAQTVVTPAARDWLRLHGVQLENVGLVGSRTSRTVGILVADPDGLRRCAFIANQLAQRGVSIRGVGVDDLVAACKEQAALGFVLTSQPQRMVASLFQSGLTAVQINGRDQLAELEQSLRPSVWVVDMRDQTLPTVTNRIHACIRNRNTLAVGVSG